MVVSEYNRAITQKLEENCLRELKKAGVSPKNISVTHVPGAFEIPWTCQQVIRKTKPHAVIALGCIVRGETPHFDFIASACAAGIMEVGLRLSIPIAFGVLTTNNQAQTKARLDKGAEAAHTILKLLNPWKN
ncbi:MAG: 6,7-dimethyl-8-ribityllumazine synthase [Candidatus Peregrinibacteria bacterium]